MNLPVLPMVCLVDRYFRYHCFNLKKNNIIFRDSCRYINWILCSINYHPFILFMSFSMVDNRECRPNIIFYRIFTFFSSIVPCMKHRHPKKRLELFLFLYFHKMKFITFIFKNILFRLYIYFNSLHSNDIYCRTQ